MRWRSDVIGLWWEPAVGWKQKPVSISSSVASLAVDPPLWQINKYIIDLQ